MLKQKHRKGLVPIWTPPPAGAWRAMPQEEQGGSCGWGDRPPADLSVQWAPA